MQDCGISTADTPEILQSCTKPPIYNEFEIYIVQTTATTSRGQWVKGSLSCTKSHLQTSLKQYIQQPLPLFMSCKMQHKLKKKHLSTWSQPNLTKRHSPHSRTQPQGISTCWIVLMKSENLHEGSLMKCKYVVDIISPDRYNIDCWNICLGSILNT